jgi:hypothetical protein
MLINKLVTDYQKECGQWLTFRECYFY